MDQVKQTDTTCSSQMALQYCAAYEITSIVKLHFHIWSSIKSFVHLLVKCKTNALRKGQPGEGKQLSY